MTEPEFLLSRFGVLLRHDNVRSRLGDPWLVSILARCDHDEFCVLIRGLANQRVGAAALADVARLLLVVRASGTLTMVEGRSAVLAAVGRYGSGTAMRVALRAVRLSGLTPEKLGHWLLRYTGMMPAAIRVVAAMLAATTRRSRASGIRAQIMAEILLRAGDGAAVPALDSLGAAVLARRTARYLAYAWHSGQQSIDFPPAVAGGWLRKVWSEFVGVRARLSASDVDQSVQLICLVLLSADLRRLENRNEARAAVERVCPMPAGPFSRHLKAAVLRNLPSDAPPSLGSDIINCVLNGAQACPLCTEFTRRKLGRRPSHLTAVPLHVDRELTDVLIVSYPKSGRTWLRVFLNAYLFDGDRNGLDLFGKARGRPDVPAVTMTHGNYPQYLNVDQIAADTRRYFRGLANKSVLVLVRDPRDVAVSYYFEISRRLAWKPTYASEDASLSMLIRSPVGGIASVLAFYQGIEAAVGDGVPLTILHYEDFIAEPHQAFLRLVNAMGLTTDHERISGAIDQSSFPRMRYLEHINYFGDARLSAADPADLESFKTRRGGHGRSRRYLSEADWTWLEERIRTDLPVEFARYRDPPVLK